MRSTTVGWLTSMVRVLPVTADHIWLNRACPEFRESISHPIEPTTVTPRNSPRMRASTNPVRDRIPLLGDGRSGGLVIPQGYHSQGVDSSSCPHPRFPGEQSYRFTMWISVPFLWNFTSSIN